MKKKKPKVKVAPNLFRSLGNKVLNEHHLSRDQVYLRAVSISSSLLPYLSQSSMESGTHSPQLGLLEKVKLISPEKIVMYYRSMYVFFDQFLKKYWQIFSNSFNS